MTENRSVSLDPVPADIPGQVAWLARRYMKNSRDALFTDYLREIMVVNENGAIVPTARRNPLTNETSGVAVRGESGDGKTTMIDRNIGALPGFVRAEPGIPGNWLRCRVPPEATIKGVGELIARDTSYGGFSDKATANAIWATARHRMTEAGICLLWLDEAHHLLRPGTGRNPAAALQTLKHLLQGDDAVAVVLSGTALLTEGLLKDPETDRRFMQFDLGPLALGRDDALKLRTFIDRCCTMLDLPLPSDPHLCERIVVASNGSLGRSLDLARAIISKTITDRRNTVELEVAGRLYRMRTGSGEIHPFMAGEWLDVRNRLLEEGWM